MPLNNKISAEEGKSLKVKSALLLWLLNKIKGACMQLHRENTAFVDRFAFISNSYFFFITWNKKEIVAFQTEQIRLCRNRTTV